MKLYPVFIPHRGCPFHCIYCNQNTFSSIESPDADRLRIDIEHFIAHNPGQELEIAFYGGTFSALPESEIERWLNLIEPYLPGLHGIRFSTRPDCLDDDQLAMFKSRGVTTIELGIQSFDDSVLKAAARGYESITAIDTCKRIQNHGIRLCVQLLPGLPEDDEASWLHTIETTIEIKPDFVRIYPCVVLEGTRLAEMYRAGSFKPLSLDDAIDRCAKAIARFEQHGIPVIKTGLHGDLDTESIIAGPWHAAFGELVRSEVCIGSLPERLDGTLCISTRDVSLFLGFDRRGLKKLKRRWNLMRIPIVIDKSLPKGIMEIRNRVPEIHW